MKRWTNSVVRRHISRDLTSRNALASLLRSHITLCDCLALTHGPFSLRLVAISWLVFPENAIQPSKSSSKSQQVTRLCCFQKWIVCSWRLTLLEILSMEAGRHVQPDHHPRGWIVRIGDLLVFINCLLWLNIVQFPQSSVMLPSFLFIFYLASFRQRAVCTSCIFELRNEMRANIQYCQNSHNRY